MVHYRFFGGKGGVGKTTCAAAFAVASARAGRRTLLISTDPAPSAGDALRQPLTSAPRRIAGTAGRLHALEVDASKALERWLGPRRGTLETIALRGTWLDRDDVAALLGLSLPGVDEVAALMEIGRFGAGGRYDMVVVDTAPTGHTLRMLSMPELLRTLAVVFDRMQAKHRALVEAMRGRWTPEESDALVTSIDDEGKALASLLGDRERTSMSWVTLPEPMAVAETADALEELRRLGVGVDTVVLNRMTPVPDARCRWCNARRTFERTAVQGLAPHLTGGVRLAMIQARAREPRGLSALVSIAEEMASAGRLPRTRSGATRPLTADSGLPAAPTSLEGLERLAIVMFGGKGGVGKTTCAAAAAVRIAADHPRRPVLLLSADPAHSLADVFGAPLGDDPRRVAGGPRNLQVRELDAAARFEALKKGYADAIDALFARVGGGAALSVSADRQAMRDLMELAPPGLDELAAIVEVSEALEKTGSHGDPLVLVDTAPSGHALRLLEMPVVVHDWVKALMGILLKYQPVVGLGELGALLLRMSQGLGRLRTLLADPSRTAFVAVTRPAALPVAETTRLVERLQALDIHVPLVLVNAVGAGTCSNCTTTRRGQQRSLADIRKLTRGRALVLAAAIMPPPHGPRALRDWQRTWMGG